jgi:hypothetical protein
MPWWICVNTKTPNCPQKKVAIEQSGQKPCPQCKGQMKKTDPPKQGYSFEGLAGEVAKAVNSYPASYQKKVIDYLSQSNLTGYKDDFVAEMKKPEDFGKFVGTKARENTDTTNCFDNSFVWYAGAELPPLCPIGEKFDFEIPYLLSTFGWKYLGNGTKCYAMQVSKLLTTVREGYSYLVMTRENAAYTIGHTITLYVPSKGVIWLHDPQMIEPPSTTSVWEAWESGKQLGSTQKPGCYMNVKTGKREGEWEKS